MPASQITINKRMKPLYQIKSGVFLGYRRGYLYIADIKEKRYRKIVCIQTGLNAVFAFSRLLERIFRLEPRTAECVARNIFVIPCKGSMYRVDIGEKKISKELTFTRGMNSPLSITKIENLRGFDDCVAFGEYSANEEQQKVAIYTRKLEPRAPWKKKFEFENGKINHIHALIPDPYRESILILTGDTDSASGIWMAENNFKKVTPLLVGRQQYRACAAFPEKNSILYVTDTPLEKNYAYQLEILKDRLSLKRVCEIPGPCIYSLKTPEKIVISTSVEPDPNQKRLNYLFTRKTGSGVKCNKSFVLKSSGDDPFSVVCAFKKDRYPMGLCQLGTIQFPVNADELHLYSSAAGKDGSWVKIEEEEVCTNLHG